MSMKRRIIELIVWVISLFSTHSCKQPTNPKSIFVLRNNDIGDLIVVTPIFKALKTQFPNAKIIAGIGKWNLEVLKNNPYIDEIIEINAPWHNKFSGPVPHNSLKGLIQSLRYILFSKEMEILKKSKCDIGIDILGSPEGSFLMMTAKIPWRLGVRGYSGGHSGCNQFVRFDNKIQVGRSALRTLELLGDFSFHDAQPIITLSNEERNYAKNFWESNDNKISEKEMRILVAPGGGFVEKCWPKENFRQLIKELSLKSNLKIIILGGGSDFVLGEFVRGDLTGVLNFCGRTSLRETFALVSTADGIICNSSMISHAAAAFNIPTIVLLGNAFNSAQAHKQLWGHGLNDIHLGRENDHNEIYSVQEVLPFLLTHFKFQ